MFFFGFLFAPISLFLSVAANALSRRWEFAADAYARRTADAEAFIAALKRLSVDNLSNLTPHPFKVMLAYSHPPILQRLRALRRAPQAGMIHARSGRGRGRSFFGLSLQEGLLDIRRDP